MNKNKLNKSAGFSLIEIMVGIVIVVAATTVVLSIIISSFRISSKTTTDTVLRQNGNYALSQMSRILQFADTFNGVSTDGSSYVTNCDPNTTYHYIQVKYNGIDRTLSCTVNGDIQADTGASSIDTNKVKVGTCNFSCKPSSDGGPVIGIDFSLSSGTSADLVENRSSIDFSTSVKMRNP